jgi:hypothetical protein
MEHIPYLGPIASVPDLIKTHSIDVMLIAFNEDGAFAPARSRHATARDWMWK